MKMTETRRRSMPPTQVNAEMQVPFTGGVEVLSVTTEARRPRSGLTSGSRGSVGCSPTAPSRATATARSGLPPPHTEHLVRKPPYGLDEDRRLGGGSSSLSVVNYFR